MPPFSVMVGANASGKSNFVDALDFLSFVGRSGLAAAVRAKGGYENICFRRIRRSRAEISFELTAHIEDEIPSLGRRMKARTIPLDFRLIFAFRAPTGAMVTDYKVTREHLSVVRSGRPEARLEIERDADGGKRVHIADEFQRDVPMPSQRYLDEFFQAMPLQEDELSWYTGLRTMYPFWAFTELLGACRVYHISPEMARQPGIPERSPELGRHGENLPATVEFLKRTQPEAFNELLSHLRHAVDTMEGVETSYLDTNELGLFFRERGVGARWYAQDVSDGTVRVVGMFLALLDPRTRILAIEEPENSLHPWILRHFVDVCKAHSQTKQILLTTHSPVALDAVPVESLFLVRRSNGETVIERVQTEYPEAKTVIEEALFGLGQYWDSGGIGAVPEVAAEGVSE